MVKQLPKPDLLRVYTNDYGEMQVDYDGRPLGILASSPYIGYQQMMQRPSMFDRHTVELSIIDMGPDYFKSRAPYNTVNTKALAIHFAKSPSIERVPA